ncbi:MAG: hypothetical protein M0Z34_10585 [Nitrospiraceae bacterium]|nr:hypothetical protein [Nitrospiraceae bacterium]
MLLVTRSQVRAILDWEDVIQATKRGLVAEVAKSAIVTAEVRYARGGLHLKSAALDEDQVLTVKANLRPDGGNVSGLLLVYDLEKGTLAAAVDSGLFTAMRTAAIATLAAQTLCRRSGIRLAVLGYGKVGQTTLERVCSSMDVADARIWTRRDLSEDEVPAKTTSGVPVRTVNDVAGAVADADLVITCTPSREPIVGPADLKESAVIVAMGADSYGKRELGEGILNRAFLVGDVPSECVRVGEFAYLGPANSSAILPLGKVLAGEAPLQYEGACVVFDSVGSSLVDAAVASALLRAVESSGAGTPVDLQL